MARATGRIAKNARAFPRKFIASSVVEVRRAVAKTLKADTGGNSALSHAGNRKLKIRTKQSGQSVAKGLIEAGAPRAQWFWLEEGTKPHIVGGRYKGARHPGTRGKRTWSRAAKPALDRVMSNAHKTLSEIVRGR